MSIQITNINDLSSDHNPVLLEFLCDLITSSPPQSNRLINWLKFLNHFSFQSVNLNPKLDTKTDIDKAITSLSEIIQSATELSVYQKKNNNLTTKLLI